MNKQGSGFILVLMLSVTFFFFGLAIAAPIMEVIGEAMDIADCSNVGLSYFEKAGCVLMDIMGPIFVGVIFGIAGALLSAKVIT